MLIYVSVTLEGLFGPGGVGYSEMLDRADVVVLDWEWSIVAHPITLLHPERESKSQEILTAKAEFSQLVGRSNRQSQSPGCCLSRVCCDRGSYRPSRWRSPDWFSDAEVGGLKEVGWHDDTGLSAWLRA